VDGWHKVYSESFTVDPHEGLAFFKTTRPDYPDLLKVECRIDSIQAITYLPQPDSD
jgi:hypothetical protein